MTITFDALLDDRLEQVTLDSTSEHIFTLFSLHKPPDKQNLGYISRTAHTLPILIRLHASLISELASKSGQQPSNLEHHTSLLLSKKRRRAYRHKQLCIPSEAISVEFEIHQSLELLNSQQENSTTGAVLWQITPLFAEWLLTPGTVFHNLLFGERENGSGLDVIEIGAGTSGILACALSLPLFAHYENDSKIGSYIATDQSHILRTLKKNVGSNMPVIQQMAAHLMHRTKATPYNSVTLDAHDKNSQDDPGEWKGHYNVRRMAKQDLHAHHARGSHSSESEKSGPRIEVLELDWEHAKTDIKDIHDCLWTSQDEAIVGKKDFDIVVACDTVYNDFLIAPFVNTLKLLAGENTHILLGMQLRSHDVQEAFLRSAQSNNLDVWHVFPEHLSERMQFGFAVYYLRRSYDCRK
ncbi:uncharacterized protein V1513DRAFT_437640 [Lipomyces chichibuensis]|uniref:uncharacterized protein n=1 Tax=Lipomyces chichibuensis TaxID=1546026 RepID=UPI003343C51E